MRTSLLMLVPCILLGGLLFGAFELHSIDKQTKVCAIGMCPLSIHTDGAGKMFSYGVTSRFTIFLDQKENPKEHLHCLPDGVIGSISNTPGALSPMYSASFEGVAPGTCTLTSDHFSATIVIR